MSDNSEPTPVARIVAIAFLFLGGVFAHVFLLPFFAHFWRGEVRLQHPIFAILSGVLLWAGIRKWTRWRLPLGVTCLLLSGLAFSNAGYYRTLQKAPEIAAKPEVSAVLDGMSRGSMAMGFLALVIGSVFLGRDRVVQRRPASP